jgi:hypothetical protein
VIRTVPVDGSATDAPLAAAQSGSALLAVPGRAADRIARAPEPCASFGTRAGANLPQRAAFETEFGGLAFAFNVALAFGWYGDFSRPLQAGLAIPPWQFLHAVGVLVAGRRFRRDPLAAWLRARVPFVAAPLPPNWQADPEWLGAFAADRRPWVLCRGDGRGWCLRHPAGFVVASGDANADPAATIRRFDPPTGIRERPPASTASAIAAGMAGERAGRGRRRRPAARDDLPQTLAHWLAARVGLALGLPPRRALARMTNLPARVVAAGERWDAHFDLAALPLALRLAGLDRDPGWIPAAGCDVRFHFD